MKSFVFEVSQVKDMLLGKPKRIERHVELRLVESLPGGPHIDDTKFVLALVEGAEMFQVDRKYVVEIREA